MELMDAERVGVLLLENDLYDLFLDAFLNTVRNGAGHKTGLIVATTFIASIKLKKLPIALQMIVNFEAHLRSNASDVLPSLIEALRESNYCHFEIYLLIIQKLQSEFTFKNGDDLLSIFEPLQSIIMSDSNVAL